MLHRFYCTMIATLKHKTAWIRLLVSISFLSQDVMSYTYSTPKARANATLLKINFLEHGSMFIFCTIKHNHKNVYN